MEFENDRYYSPEDYPELFGWELTFAELAAQPAETKVFVCNDAEFSDDDYDICAEFMTVMYHEEDCVYLEYREKYKKPEKIEISRDMMDEKTKGYYTRIWLLNDNASENAETEDTGMIETGMRTPPTDHERAVSLHRRIMTDAQIAQESLYDMCTALKEMRDGKLYRELGYSDFAVYCEEEIGLKRTQAYSYIAIADKLSDKFVRSSEQIGAKKLYLLTTITEEQRAEIVENTDLESTTVKELQAQIAQLKEESELDRKERDNANAAAQRWKDTAKRVQEEKEQAEKAASDAKEAQETTRTTLRNLLDKKAEQVKKLEAKVQELESRPVEVAVADNTEEVERLKAELAAAKAELKSTQDQLAEKPDVQMPLGVEPIYQNDTKAIFKPYLTAAADAINRLAEFIGQHQSDENYDFFVEKMQSAFEFANQKIQAMKGA